MWPGASPDYTVHMYTIQEKIRAEDKERQEGAPPTGASVGASGCLPGAPLATFLLQGREEEGSTRCLTAATAARFPLGGGAAGLAPAAEPEKRAGLGAGRRWWHSRWSRRGACRPQSLALRWARRVPYPGWG
jgi:hypothetical protein